MKPTFLLCVIPVLLQVHNATEIVKDSSSNQKEPKLKINEKGQQV